jgi:RHS repeat-associated protein
VEYHLTNNPTSQPHSYVKATTYEDACNLSDVKEAWSFADGLGRVRMTIGPGDNAGEHIGSGYVLYDAKGAAQVAYDPAFLGLDGQPPFDPSSPTLPGPIVDTCPFDDDSTTKTTVCKVETNYDAFGRAIETTMPNGAKTKTAFHGPLVTKAYDGNDVGGHDDANSSFFNTPTTSTKDGHGRLVEVELEYKDKNGGGTASYFSNYQYDVLGNLILYGTCKNGATYSSCANDPTIAITKLQHFDSVGRRREIEDPDAGVWKFVYDESGNIIETTDGKWNAPGSSTGNKIGYQYDDANRLIVEKCIQCERRTAGDILARYFYDSPQLQRSGRGYMNFPGTTGPGDDEPQDWVLGRLVRIEDDTGWVMFSYDRLGRQVTEAQHIEGRILDSTDGVLDEDDQIIEGNDAYYIGRVLHDDAGRITRLVYPAPSDATPLEVEYFYNLRGLTNRISGPDPLDYVEPVATYEYLLATHSEAYNARGQRLRYKYGDESQIQHIKKYDRNGRLREAQAYQTVSVDGRTPWELHHKKYEYDAASNIERIWDHRDYNHVDEYTGGVNLPYDLTIQHDSLYRVVEVEYTRTATELAAHPARGTFRRKMFFGYNPAGNLVERSTERGNEDGASTTNPTEEFYEKWLGPIITEDATSPHAFGDATPSIDADVKAAYDTNGNMTKLTIRNDAVQSTRYERFEYTWNHYDQLIKIEKYDSEGAGTPIAILYAAYDSAGQRVIGSEFADDASKDTLYVSDVMELRNDRYVRVVADGTQKIARIGLARPFDDGSSELKETRIVYVPDNLGSASLLVMDADDTSVSGNEKGCVVATTSHLPYGGIEAETHALVCGLQVDGWYRFIGKEFQRGVGLYYVGARWLNPSLGMFASVDNVGLVDNSKSHSYLYVDGKVISHFDPDGNRGRPPNRRLRPRHRRMQLRRRRSPRRNWIRRNVTFRQGTDVRINPRVFRRSTGFRLWYLLPGQGQLLLRGPGGRPGNSSYRRWKKWEKSALRTMRLLRRASPGRGSEMEATATALARRIQKERVARRKKIAAPKGGASNLDVRKWYHSQLDAIPGKIGKSASMREQALQAFKLRNEAKLAARKMMDPEQVANLPPLATLKDLVRKGYRLGLRGNDLWRYIRDSSTRSNVAVDKDVGTAR